VTELIAFLVLVAVAYVTGTLLEQRHFRSIARREAELLPLAAVPLRKVCGDDEILDGWLVTGSVYVSVDYFKRFLSSLQSLLGMRLGAYEPLLDRARREALLRMKDNARGADVIVNVRLETSAINGREGGRSRRVAGVEVLAYGTALKLKSADAAVHC